MKALNSLKKTLVGVSNGNYKGRSRHLSNPLT